MQFVTLIMIIIIIILLLLLFSLIIMKMHSTYEALDRPETSVLAW